jgi:carboxypeptidase Taq
MAVLADLRNVAQLLEWDQQTMMPPRGVVTRAETAATVQRISHEMFVSDETGRLIDAAAGQLDGASPESDEASLVRVTRRNWEKARRVPTELASDLARASSVGHQAWIVARETSDFASFVPYLERNFDLIRQYVDCFDTFDCAYDAVLDDFEPGASTADVVRLFGELKTELVPLIAAVGEHADRVDDSPLHGDFPVDRQRGLVRWVVEQMGFDRAGWPASALGMYASLPDGMRPSYPPRCTGPCTSVVTACTRRVWRNRCNARHSATPNHWGCTNPRAVCGRTWWDADARSAGCWHRESPSCSAAT